ncbi:RraA family protein [Treponema sp. OMZ 840]|uniref:RraA family protein n=1 Tax=Treponema sp. OMZ 840 TaxID=244313 RepID=UPI003D91EDAA
MKDLLKELEKYDTPSITNAIATYPQKHDTCLGQYHPWNGHWYTNQTLKCMFPNLGPKAGVVVTVVYGMPDPLYERLTFKDLLLALDKIKDPIVLAVKQNFPPKIKKRNGLLGGNMLTAFKSMGVVGVLSDGPSRDVDEIRALNVQYMLTGVTAGHGPFAIEAINVPVNICGMHVMPKDIIHMDENGAVKFSSEMVTSILDNVKRITEAEKKRQNMIKKTTDALMIAEILKGVYD